MPKTVHNPPRRRSNFKSRDVARVVAAASAAGLSIGSIEVTPRHGGEATIRIYSQNGSAPDEKRAAGALGRE